MLGYRIERSTPLHRHVYVIDLESLIIHQLTVDELKYDYVTANPQFLTSFPSGLISFCLDGPSTDPRRIGVEHQTLHHGNIIRSTALNARMDLCARDPHRE